MAIIKDVKALAYYIQQKHQEVCGSPISPLKLQKSLYFLFAYWGGFISKAKKAQKNKQNIEVDLSKYDEYLFDSPIEAWVYGPVIPEAYKHRKNLVKFKKDSLFDGQEYVKNFVDDLLLQIFKISDFRLVDIAHSDKVWKSYFDKDNLTHSAEMPKKEIIAEYANRY